jgi:hypothetical protein
MLRITPKDSLLTPLALERTFLALHSPSVRLQPGTKVRISAWVRIPGPISASPDGALIYDSVGGEPLAIRLFNPCKWTKYSVFREVPANGVLSMTMALTGLGTVYFDDLRIEPLVPRGSTGAVDEELDQEKRGPDGSVSPGASPEKPAAAPPFVRGVRAGR